MPDGSKDTVITVKPEIMSNKMGPVTILQNFYMASGGRKAGAVR